MKNRFRPLPQPTAPPRVTGAFGKWYNPSMFKYDWGQANRRTAEENKKRYSSYLRGYGREATGEATGSAAGGAGNPTETVSTAAKTSGPSIQDIQEQYRAAAERARGREFPEFDRIANLSQLNFLAARESAEERAAKASMAQAAQEQNRGFTSLGGQKAGDEIYRRDIRQGQLQADQSAARAMTEKLKFEQARDDRANAMDARGIDVAGQFAMQKGKHDFQREVGDAQREYYKTRDKQQYDLAVKQADRDFRAKRWGLMMEEQRSNAQIQKMTGRGPGSPKWRGYGSQQLTGTNIFSSPYGFDSEWS